MQSKVKNRATLMASVAAFNTLGIANYSSPGEFYYSYLQWKKAKGDWQAMKVAAQHKHALYKTAGKMIAKKLGKVPRRHSSFEDREVELRARLLEAEMDAQMWMALALGE